MNMCSCKPQPASQAVRWDILQPLLPQRAPRGKGSMVYNPYHPEIWFINPEQDPGCPPVISPRITG